ELMFFATSGNAVITVVTGGAGTLVGALYGSVLLTGLKSVVGSWTEHHLVVGAEAMTAPVLEIRDLSIRFGGLRAVDHVSFSIARNRITTVIGPNGAGKSTLFNLISGALKPHAGQVLVEGRDYTGAPPYRLQAAGLARS